MIYTLNTVPEDALPYRREEAARLRGKFVSETRERHGVLYWTQSGNPVPPHCFDDAFCTPPAAQQAAHDSHQEAAIEAYIRARAQRTPDQIAEEAFERRAAFGPGVEVVDVITGERSFT